MTSRELLVPGPSAVAVKRQFWAERKHADTSFVVFLEFDTGLTQEINRILSIHVFTKVEFKVELPGTRPRYKVTLFVAEREAELDYFQLSIQKGDRI